MLITMSSIFAMTVICAASPNETSSRIIATGWDSPTPARFRTELAEFEKWGCFDGTTIAPTSKLSDGRVVDCRRAFSREHWEWAEFKEAVKDLREAKPTKAKSNFLFVYANPGDVDWLRDHPHGDRRSHEMEACPTWRTKDMWWVVQVVPALPSLLSRRLLSLC